MCGFAGVVTWDDRYRVSRQTLSRMSDAVAHRGPDGEAIWLNHDVLPTQDNPQCGLAFRRLAILDPDPRSMQPMTDGRHWLVFNGEIYNFRDLRNRLDAVDHYDWKTTGDSETLLRAYALHGEKCFEWFYGMFAFAVWDQVGGTLLLARDRMGQKPLYFTFAPGRRAVAFASELSALKVLEWPDFSIDQMALSQYLRTGYVAAPATIYQGVAKLPPGNYLVCPTARVPAARIYFDANGDGESGEPALLMPPSVESIREGVTKAVKRQMVSDVPIGCWLSGGIDSSVIAAAMTKALPPGQKLNTYTIGFDEPEYDETKYAAEVAQKLGTEHQQFVVRPDVAEDLPKLARVFGEPFADSSALPTHYLSEQTRQHVKVVLSGDGGDELFGGYERYRAIKYSVPRPIRPVLRAIATSLPGANPKSFGARFKRFAAAMDMPPHRRYAEYTSMFDLPDLIGLQRQNIYFRDLIAETYQRLMKPRDLVQTALATDRLTYLPDDLLTKVDRASMLHGLEVRSPFMDHELVHAAAGMLSWQLTRGGPKRMLRKAFARDLPPSVFKRPKMGFAVPLGQWLRTSLRPMMNDLLTSSDSFVANNFDVASVARLMEEHQLGGIDHSQKLYGLVMLEVWWRQQKR
jgi:asparagine synthase (glutamine-hydrolysing)